MTCLSKWTGEARLCQRLQLKIRSCGFEIQGESSLVMGGQTNKCECHLQISYKTKIDNRIAFSLVIFDDI